MTFVPKPFLIEIEALLFLIIMERRGTRNRPGAASPSGALQPVATVSVANLLRVASDGGEYNWEEWYERYGPEWASVLWARADVPLHVALDGEVYTWEQYMWYYGENATTMWNLPSRRLQIPIDSLAFIQRGAVRPSVSLRGKLLERNEAAMLQEIERPL